MREGGDVLALGDNIDKALQRITADLPLGIEPHLVANQPVTVHHAIGEFMESLWQAVAIILAMSFLSLGVRPGLVVAFAIPLTLAIVFAIMLILGIDMQRISLGALIIALALMVDDAMTTTDATLTRLAAGDDKPTAAIYAFKDLRRRDARRHDRDHRRLRADRLRRQLGRRVLLHPVRRRHHRPSGLLAGGGDLRTLLSLFLLKVPSRAAARAATRRALVPGVPHPGAARPLADPAITAGDFVGSVLLLPLIPRQFFPASDRPELLVDLTLPQNASIFATDTLSSRFDAVLAGDPDVDRWSTWVGRGAIRFYLPLDVQLANPFFAQAVIVAKDVAARDRLQAKLEQTLAEEFPNVIGRVSPLELGPPVGWPVQYRVSGPDPRWCARSPSTLPVPWPRARTRSGPTSTGSSRRARCASASTRTRRACSA